MQTQIKKWGNSQGIRIPKHILTKLDLKTSDIMSLNVDKDKIILEKIKVPKRKNIIELFDGYEDDYSLSEFDWGEAVGEEIW